MRLLFSYAALLPLALAQLGISGTEQSVCKTVCDIATQCRSWCTENVCSSVADWVPYVTCLCQPSCVEFRGVCRSCCNATAPSDQRYTSDMLYIPPFCHASNDYDWVTCNTYGNRRQSENADVFSNLSYNASSTLPSSAASWISALPSPSGVQLQGPIVSLPYPIVTQVGNACSSSAAGQNSIAILPASEGILVTTREDDPSSSSTSTTTTRSTSVQPALVTTSVLFPTLLTPTAVTTPSSAAASSAIAVANVFALFGLAVPQALL